MSWSACWRGPGFAIVPDREKSPGAIFDIAPAMARGATAKDGGRRIKWATIHGRTFQKTAITRAKKRPACRAFFSDWQAADQRLSDAM